MGRKVKALVPGHRKKKKDSQTRGTQQRGQISQRGGKRENGNLCVLHGCWVGAGGRKGWGDEKPISFCGSRRKANAEIKHNNSRLELRRGLLERQGKSQQPKKGQRGVTRWRCGRAHVSRARQKKSGITEGAEHQNVDLISGDNGASAFAKLKGTGGSI